MAMRSVNPMNGEVVREYAEMDDRAVRQALLEASCAFAGWRTVPMSVRAEKMRFTVPSLTRRRVASWA